MANKLTKFFSRIIQKKVTIHNYKSRGEFGRKLNVYFRKNHITRTKRARKKYWRKYFLNQTFKLFRYERLQHS